MPVRTPAHSAVISAARITFSIFSASEDMKHPKVCRRARHRRAANSGHNEGSPQLTMRALALVIGLISFPAFAADTATSQATLSDQAPSARAVCLNLARVTECA